MSDVQPKEIAAINELQTELQRSMPELDEQTIKSCIGTVWSSFRTARVRDFVPLLVRREVLAELKPRRTASP
jgi:hypothetical protein